MKLAIVGLQGLDPHLAFDELADEMPNLQALVERGAHGPIASTHPPERVPAWSVFATGQTPGRLGLTGLRNRDWQATRMGQKAPYGEGAQAGLRELSEPSLWRLAGQAGREVALVGAPHTFPVEPVNGSLVAWPPSPSERRPRTHPAELADALEAEIGDLSLPGTDPEVGRDERLETARRDLDRRFDVAQHVAAEGSWELFFLLAEAPARAQAAAWSTHDSEHPLHEEGQADELARAYRHLDDRLGELVEALPEEAAVLVASATGAQACRGSLRLNAWLQREGYLALEAEPEAKRRFDPGLVDWTRTRAWAEGGAAGRIHLNVAGREPQGIVDPLDYEDVREQLQARLAGIEADGRRLEVRSFKPRELYEGPRVDEAPDLSCYVEGLAYRCEATVGHEALVGEPQRGHDEAAPTREGSFVLADPEGRFSGRVDELAVADAAPTALDLLGVSVPGGLDGRVLQPDGSLQT